MTKFQRDYFLKHLTQLKSMTQDELAQVGAVLLAYLAGRINKDEAQQCTHELTKEMTARSSWCPLCGHWRGGP